MKVCLHYNYNDADVYALLYKNVPRKTYLYARVSTPKQKKALTLGRAAQAVDHCQRLCHSRGLFGLASGITFDKRKDFFAMLDDVLDYQVERVIITHKDRPSRTGFSLFQHIFQKHGTDITVVSEADNPKLDTEETFEEIISLLHCYSMKLYSKRRKRSKGRSKSQKE